MSMSSSTQCLSLGFMKTNTSKNLEHYLGLPYTLILRPDEDGDFVARVKELAGCVAHGRTGPEALENLKEVQKVWLEDCLESGQTVPEPSVEEHLPSGKWLQRVPRTLHKQLAQRAEFEGVSLNQLVTAMLSTGLVSRTASADTTEPEMCKSCPLNRADLWQRVVEPGDWHVEGTNKPLSTSQVRPRLRRQTNLAHWEDFLKVSR